MIKEQLINEAFARAGQMSDIARRIVGGKDFMFGNEISSCRLEDLPNLMKELKLAVDQYDQAIYNLNNFFPKKEYTPGV